MNTFAQNEAEKRFESLWFAACLGHVIGGQHGRPEDSLSEDERAELAAIITTIGEDRAAYLKTTI